MGETPGVYIHIPFCASRCDYCDFYTVTRRGDLFEPYTEAVCRAVATAPLAFFLLLCSSLNLKL